jgi:23S rRNA pseudouridine1911/1915/1917 synthase
MNENHPETREEQQILTIGALSVETFADNILLEDNHLLGVFKPAGMLTQGDRSGEPSLLDIARDWLRIRYDKPGNVFVGMVHRLDRPVSGVVLFAKTSKAAGRLSAQFRGRNMRKTYHALVRGVPKPEARRVEHYLVREGARTFVASQNQPGAGARRAKLFYHTIRRGKTCSLLEIDLHTGRKHQIRAQLSALGHPIVGDRLYGSPVSLENGSIALQANALVFIHPTRNEEVVLQSPVALTDMFPKID